MHVLKFTSIQSKHTGICLQNYRAFVPRRDEWGTRTRDTHGTRERALSITWVVIPRNVSNGLQKVDAGRMPTEPFGNIVPCMVPSGGARGGREGGGKHKDMRNRLRSM